MGQQRILLSRHGLLLSLARGVKRLALLAAQLPTRKYTYWTITCVLWLLGFRGTLIGGAGLARGYLKRPDLTAEKFIPNPFSPEPGARLYRTGDLARYRPDGNIEFLGRIDHQVKVRGFRIELEEIETVLGHHPEVRENAVVAREDNRGDKRLVAYVVPNQRQSATVAELRSFLKQKLPDYMVPSAFVFLDVLPLTRNGKVNWNALPEPDDTRPELDESYIGPRTPLEEILAKMWIELLSVEKVGIQDNFFDLGGHSLLAIRLINQIEKRLGKSLSLASLFQSPTVESLARNLQEVRKTEQHSSLVPFQMSGSKPPLFLHGASFELSRYLGKDQPIYGLEPHGQDGRRAPDSVEEMASDCLRQIRSIQPEGPYFIGGFSFGGLVAFEMAQQLLREGQEVRRLILIDPTAPTFESVPKGTTPVKSTSGANRYLSALIHHLQAQKNLGPKERLHYVFKELEWRTGSVQSKLKLLLCQLYLCVGFRLPSRLRMPYFFEISAKAARKYTPGPYHGHIVLLRSQGTAVESKSDWSKLAVGDLEIYELPGAHLDPIKGHLVEAWGKQLKSCLLEAQETENKPPPLELTG